VCLLLPQIFIKLVIEKFTKILVPNSFCRHPSLIKICGNNIEKYIPRNTTWPIYMAVSKSFTCVWPSCCGLWYITDTRKSLNLSTRCVRNRLVASLSTSCNNAVILSSWFNFDMSFWMFIKVRDKSFIMSSTHVKRASCHRSALESANKLSTNLFTSRRQVVFALLVPSCCNKLGTNC
jgi:hypothetical protein